MSLLKHTKKSSKKRKLVANLSTSESDEENSEHELSHYKNDKIKMMKQVLKILKPKKIKSMAPDCIKNLDIEEINAMLLEELLGISNKRLGYIFNGENADRETSSSESEDEKAAEVISLDDISDDDIEMCIGPDERNSVMEELNRKHKKRASKHCTKSIKSEKSDKPRKKATLLSDKVKNSEENNDKDKLMSVLELLELQARARAIRSQLALEAAKKKEKEPLENSGMKLEEISDDEDAVIVQSPKKDEIVIDSSDSDDENSKLIPSTSNEREQTLSDKNTERKKEKNVHEELQRVEEKPTGQKVKIIRDWSIKDNIITDNSQKEKDMTFEIKEKCLDAAKSENTLNQEQKQEESDLTEKSSMEKRKSEIEDNHSECGDAIVINLDEDEINEMEEQ